MTSSIRLYLRLLNQEHHWRKVIDNIGGEVLIDDAGRTFDPIVPAQFHPNIVGVSSEIWQTIPSITWAREKGIPTLLLQDGIMEWRHQWENPMSAYGGHAPYDQPILCDKVACMGAQSLRQFERWGNVGKTELTGMPRLDDFHLPPPRARSEKPTVLVMTSKVPWFTEKQREVTIESLRDLKTYLDECDDLDVVWRLTKGLEESLEVRNTLDDLEGGDLLSVLSSVDCVVTTASTAIVEAMLAGLPTALLDYHNTPHYVPTAWVISARRHIAPILEEMVNRDPKRMLFQDEILQDVLFRLKPATPLVVTLIEKMVKHAEKTKAVSLSFPPVLLEETRLSSSYPSRWFDLRKIYPSHPLLSIDDNAQLRAQVAALKRENDVLRSQVKARSFGRVIEAMFRISKKVFRVK